MKCATVECENEALVTGNYHVKYGDTMTVMVFSWCFQCADSYEPCRALNNKGGFHSVAPVDMSLFSYPVAQIEWEQDKC